MICTLIIWKPVRLVCLSDTHTFGKQIRIPDGDVLIHAGDLTLRGTEHETNAALAWLESLPHKLKIVCAGNHDWFFDPKAPRRFQSWSLYRHHTITQLLEKFPTLNYLQDSSLIVDGLHFYGSPWQPWFNDWAFNLPRDGVALTAKWAAIPPDTNVLVTHGPPFGILDRVQSGEHVGCAKLLQRLNELMQLQVCIFGHIHEGYGREQRDSVQFVNVSICDAQYRPVNRPIVLDLKRQLS